MRAGPRVPTVGAILFAAAAALHGAQDAVEQPAPGTFQFSGGVELVNVTATVSDRDGRFVSGLTREDFVVYEDDRPQSITHFSAERVPVSLGAVIDTSGSMAGDKIRAARGALGRFLTDLLDPSDELFLYQFSDRPVLMQSWTSDRRLLSLALGRMQANGGTAMYDAAAEAVPMAAGGSNRKRAIVIISDGNDTASRARVGEVKQLIRESEVLVYAVGIDAEGGIRSRRPIRMPIPLPPGGGRWPPPSGGPGPGGFPGGFPGTPIDQRVNVVALRELTDDSGGRTEIIRTAQDLDPATEGIADELRQQYYIGYPTSGTRDGRWRQIRVEVKNGKHRVRARRGYFAT